MTKDNSIPAAQMDWAASFISRGLSVLILHDVSAGQCSCMPRRDGTECKPKNQGKHPRMGGAWQHAGLTRLEDAAPWLTAHPFANLGILTGPPSGVWVLDVDPDNGGDVALAELEAAHGPLPVTYTVRTGSGGRHHYFALPDDFTPTNANRLPLGLDTRGAGGQVVAPGSRTLLGEYAVEVDAPPAAAPDWLLDYVRPRPVVESAAGSVGAGAAADWAPQARDPRLTAYALAAVRGELDRLAGAAPGGRGATAHGVAMALIELCNSGWSGLDAVAVRLAYLDAAAQAAAAYVGGGHDFDVAEAERIWDRDVMRVAGRGRVVPPELDFGGVVPGVDWSAGAGVPPFGTAGPGGVAAGTLANPFAIPAPRNGSELGSLTESHAQSHGVSFETVDPSAVFEAAVAREMAQLQVRAEAKRRVAAATAAGHAQAVERIRAALLDPDDLDSLPTLEPLVAGWLAKDSVARISGAPGSGKSFVIMDIAACVGTGTPWQGHDVEQGTAVVLVAEGVRGIAKRRRAWSKAYGKPMTGVKFLPLPVQATGPEWDAFVEVVAELKPSLVVLDTQARVTVGVDENSATEMGVFVHAIERLRLATGACVLLVHHTSADSDRARGSTAVNGAMQTELVVRRNRNEITVINTKQKDDAAAHDLVLSMIQIELGTDERGDVINSVVLRQSLTGGVGGMDNADAAMKLNAVMRDVFDQGRGGTKSEVYGVAVTERRLMSKSQFYKAWNKLVIDGNIAIIEGTQSWRYVPVEDRPNLLQPAPGGGMTITGA